MVSSVLLAQVLLDNRQLVQSKQIFKREVAIDDFPRCVLVGVRRSGKSYMLYQKIQSLLASGKSWNEMLYLNFEDERLLGFDVSDFNQILAVHAEMTGSKALPILFLDEIQLIDGWEKFVRRMADAGAQIYITGSNAKMLSVDVAATLGGRFLTINVFPMSFSEVLSAKGISCTAENIVSTIDTALIRREFNTYFQFGGFPESLDLKNKLEYINTVYQKIYLGDIAVRNKINNLYPLRILIKKIADSIGQPLSYTRLTNLITSVGVKIAKTTCISYVQYAYDSCLLHAMSNFVGKLQDRESNPKIYLVDNGLIALLKQDPMSDQLENLVALQLLRQYGFNDAVFYYRRDVEVDFYIPETETAIQVCVRLGTDPKTRAREVNAFEKMGKELTIKRKIIVTLDEESVIETASGPIEVIPAWKWLLER